MDDASASSYIHTVQHLIEECILFNMSREECMEALSKHADILPVITSTIWKELEKENKQFFESYHSKRRDRKTPTESSETTSSGTMIQRIQNMRLDSTTN